MRMISKDGLNGIRTEVMTGQCDHWVTYPQSNTLDSIFPQREKKQRRNKEEEFLACEGARLPPPFLICPFILQNLSKKFCLCP